jgi:hypothetical protein
VSGWQSNIMDADMLLPHVAKWLAQGMNGDNNTTHCKLRSIHIKFSHLLYSGNRNPDKRLPTSISGPKIVVPFEPSNSDLIWLLSFVRATCCGNCTKSQESP